MPPAELLSGLIAAPFTPLRSDGALNLPMIDRLARSLAANSVSGAFVCGTTGEGSSLTSDERRAVAERWAKVKPAKLKLIVHVGHNSQAESCALARHAGSLKADAIATLAPSFFKPTRLEDLIAWCAQVAEAAPRTPFYYYHMPAMTGVDFQMVDFLPAARKAIPTFSGIKFTHENLMDYGRTVVRAEDQQAVLFGRDEILLSGLVLGARGAVGSTYNYMAPIYNKLMAYYASGELAGAHAQQIRSMEIIAIMVKHGGLSAGKAIMKMIGLDCGPTRAPLRTLSIKQESALRSELRKADFFHACSLKK